MGIWAWLILLAWGVFLATGAQVTLLRDAGPTDYDWVYIAGGALLGGFTAHVWYPGFGPVFDGLNVVQALAGGVAGGLLAELIYRFLLGRPRLA
jgi:cytochrome c biogenesis protein CcdA